MSFTVSTHDNDEISAYFVESIPQSEKEMFFDHTILLLITGWLSEMDFPLCQKVSLHTNLNFGSVWVVVLEEYDFSQFKVVIVKHRSCFNDYLI